MTRRTSLLDALISPYCQLIVETTQKWQRW